MANPEYHRRLAELFTRLSEIASDANIALEMKRLAAEHSAWARRGESVVNGRNKPALQARRHNAA
jgi:hypothetical protein